MNITEQLQNYEGTLDEFLTERNLNLKEALDLCIPKKPIFINKTPQKRYRIIKTIEGKKVQYGTYATLKDALLIRDCLIMCKWDKTKLKNIQEHFGIKEAKTHYKFIRYNTETEEWTIIKKKNKETIEFKFKNKEDAVICRDYLVEKNWHTQAIMKVKKWLKEGLVK